MGGGGGGKLCRSEGIKLINGQTINEVDGKGYKYPGTIKRSKEQLQEVGRKSRKIMTIYKELHPRSDVARIDVPRKKGGRGLISCESCVR